MANTLLSQLKNIFSPTNHPKLDIDALRKQAKTDPLACALFSIKDRLNSFNEDKILDIAWEYAERGDTEMAEKLISFTRKESKQNHRISFVTAGVYYQLGDNKNFAKFFKKGIKLSQQNQYHDIDFDFYRIAKEYLSESRIGVFIEYIKEIQKLGESGLYVLNTLLSCDINSFRTDLLEILDSANNIKKADKDSSFRDTQIIAQFYAKLSERKLVDKIVTYIKTTGSQIELLEAVVKFLIENKLNKDSGYYLKKMVPLIESLNDDEEKIQIKIKLSTLSQNIGDSNLVSQITISEPEAFSENYFEYLLVSNQIENAVKYISEKKDLEDKLKCWLKICNQLRDTGLLNQDPSYLENTWVLLREFPDDVLEKKSKYLEEFTPIAAQSGNKELTESVVESYIKVIHHPDKWSYFNIDQIENYIKILLDTGASQLAKRVMSERDEVYETWPKKKQMLIEKVDLDNYQLNLFIKNNQLKELAGFVNEKIPDDLKRYHYLDLALQYAKLKSDQQPPWEEISEIILDSLSNT